MLELQNLHHHDFLFPVNPVVSVLDFAGGIRVAVLRAVDSEMRGVLGFLNGVEPMPEFLVGLEQRVVFSFQDLVLLPQFLDLLLELAFVELVGFDVLVIFLFQSLVFEGENVFGVRLHLFEMRLFIFKSGLLCFIQIKKNIKI